ncbi:MAG: cytochrome c oxidase assembly protein [Acidimicrobiales bacterium]
MTTTATGAPLVALPAWVRPALTCGAVALLVGVLVPPLATAAQRYEYVEALRFSVLAVVVPALIVVGAPWSFLRLANRGVSDRPLNGHGEAGGPIDRLAAGRQRHLGFMRSLGVLLIEMTLIVAARTPPVVDALAKHQWLVVIEAVCLISAGIALWLELVESPPLEPRLARPKRIALAAVTMWTIWISAYLVGLSHASVYADYHRLAGTGLTYAADQEITTFVLWFVAAAAFVPVVFWNLVMWLRTEEDPDQALHRLVRETRRRAWGSQAGAAGAAPGSGGPG